MRHRAVYSETVCRYFIQSFDMFLAFPPFRRLLCGSEEIYMKKPVALPGIKHVAAEGIVPSGGQHYGKETGNSEKKIYSRRDFR